MNVKSVEKENGKAKILVEIDKEQFETALNKAYHKNKKDIFVPGFGKGKAPRKVIEGMYGAGIFHEEAINIMFPEVYTAAVVGSEASGHRRSFRDRYGVGRGRRRSANGGDRAVS